MKEKSLKHIIEDAPDEKLKVIAICLKYGGVLYGGYDKKNFYTGYQFNSMNRYEYTPTCPKCININAGVDIHGLPSSSKKKIRPENLFR